MNQKEQLLTFMNHLKAGRRNDANRMLDEIMAASPQKAGPYALLIGGMLAQSGQIAEAVPADQEAIRLNPHDEVLPRRRRERCHEVTVGPPAQPANVEFEGKPLFEFEGWRKTNSNLLKYFRQNFEGNRGTESAGSKAAV